MENVCSRKMSSGLFAFTENWILAVCQNIELIFGKHANKSLVMVNRILHLFTLWYLDWIFTTGTEPALKTISRWEQFWCSYCFTSAKGTTTKFMGLWLSWDIFGIPGKCGQGLIRVKHRLQGQIWSICWCVACRWRRICCPARCCCTASGTSCASCGSKGLSTNTSWICWTRSRTSSRCLRSWSSAWPASATSTPLTCW